MEIQLKSKLPDNIDTEYIIARENGDLLLKKGYAWDGPSGPCPDVVSLMKASLVHDALYQLMRLNLLDRSYRKLADWELKRFYLETGGNKILAELIYWGARKFCGPSARTEIVPPVYEIP